MTSNAVELSSAPARRTSTPILETGDVLSRDEFERRYHLMPNVKKAELIEGVVHMPSPVRFDFHAAPHADLITILGNYRTFTPGVRVADNTSIRLDMDNEPQPDASLIINPQAGGQVHRSPDDYIEGAPELVAEIAASSVGIDLNRKLHVYRRNQVREYLVWRVLDEEFDWFVLRGSQFEKLTPDGEGRLCSEVFPGLWMNVPALLRGEMLTVFQSLQQGIASEAHQAFCETISQKMKT